MRQLLNTLFVTSEDVYLSLDGENVVANRGGEAVARYPLHTLQSIVTFSYSGASPALMGACAKREIGLAFCTQRGHFLARVSGQMQGNVLLRRAQYRLSEHNPVPIARHIIAAKIQSGRRVLQRRLRNHGDQEEVQAAVSALNFSLQQLKRAESLALIRGIEGDAAARYFGVFRHLLRENSGFAFDGRNRRPPRDGVNALLSFVYSILGKDISGALQGVGLDPQVGFLHADRPGRDSLAQDILEEFRAWWADRLVLSLINRGQIKPQDFVTEAGGAVNIKPEARKLLFQTLQTKKQEKIVHPFLQEEVAVGLLPHIQAMLLARHLRGDLAEYPPFLMR